VHCPVCQALHMYWKQVSKKVGSTQKVYKYCKRSINWQYLLIYNNQIHHQTVRPSNQKIWKDVQRSSQLNLKKDEMNLKNVSAIHSARLKCTSSKLARQLCFLNRFVCYGVVELFITSFNIYVLFTICRFRSILNLVLLLILLFKTIAFQEESLKR